MADDTNIRIKRETWERLRDRKGPGESFDEVISGLIEESESSENTSATA